jgi:hypothetical protein
LTVYALLVIKRDYRICIYERRGESIYIKIPRRHLPSKI